MKKYKVLFCDMDGTLIETASGETFPKGIWDMKFKFDVMDAIKNLNPEEIFIVTNQERINEIAEEKFLEYVKESGIKLSYEVNGTPYIFHHDLLNELNYEERGYPESVSERVKHIIADDITEALNDKFKGLKDEVLNYALSEFDKQKHGLEATVKIWKHFALIFIITTIVLTIRLFLL